MFSYERDVYLQNAKAPYFRGYSAVLVSVYQQSVDSFDSAKGVF